jgi:hypothetical protein
MIKEYTEVIGGKTYRTKTLPATEGLLLLPRILSLLGEKVANVLLVSGDENQALLLDNPKVIAGVLMQIAERAAESGGLLAIKDTLRHTECDDVKVGDAVVKANVHERFDTHFAGDYRHLLEVFWWVARRNFIDP